MEHAGRRVRAPSPRAIRSARLRPSWSTPEGESGCRAPARFGWLACGALGARWKENPDAEPPSNSVGSLAALMEHAGRRVRAPSPRAIRSARLRPSWSTPEGESGRRAPERFGRLACGPHGARRKESPGAEPPSDSVGSLVALMEHAGRKVRAPSLRANGRLACGPHGA